MPGTLIQIKAPHFVAGLILHPDKRHVVKAAPIIKYMIGWTARQVWDYSKEKNWECYQVHPSTRALDKHAPKHR